MMKKLSALLLSLLFLLVQCAFAEGAPDAFTAGDYSYLLTEEDTAVITMYTGAETGITIPDTLDGHPVDRISDGAFAGSPITKLTIPESVTGIGIAAFNNSAALTEAVILGSVTTIDIATFADCHALKKITLPESVTSIGDSAFASCYELGEINLPEGLTSIGVYAFPSTALTEVVIPDSVTSIAEGAFGWCFDLTSVTLPASIPGLDLSSVFTEVLDGITFIVPAGSDSEQLCREAGVQYTYTAEAQ